MPRPAIGSITPSSNRIVERATAEVLRHIPGVDSCIARIPYYGHGIGQPADGYDHEPYRQAAWTLGHAAVDVVCWNGTRGAGFGLAADEALCATMAAAAGCKATTTSLATATLLRKLGARRVGFVTPSDARYAARAAEGLGCEAAAVRSLDLTDNLAAASLPAEQIAALVRAVASETKLDAVVLWSTNLPGLEVMAPLEAELGIAVLDSAAIGVWAALAAIGVDPRPAAALGRMFTVTP